jgi:hypothetical protein
VGENRSYPIFTFITAIFVATMDRGENEGGENREPCHARFLLHSQTSSAAVVASNSSKAKPLFQKISARWREAWLKFEVNSLFGFVWSLGDK